MRWFLVGDGHYTGAEGEADRFAHLLDRAEAEKVSGIAVLGDFFELWIGLPGLETPWQEPLFTRLRASRARGIELVYVIGNKDYFVEEWNRRHGLFHRVVETCTLDTDAGPVHLAHGDLVNHADRQYRAWRATSRSLPMRLLAKALPRRLLARLGERTAERLRGTNRYHKSYFPEAELRARARELPPGKGTLVYGHFHVHRELDEGDKKIATLPFLGAENAGLIADARGLTRLEA